MSCSGGPGRRLGEDTHLGFRAHFGAELINVDIIKVGMILDFFPQFRTGHLVFADALHTLLLLRWREVLLHADVRVGDELGETGHVDEVECAGGHGREHGVKDIETGVVATTT